ncbi:uncharacterized protein B4U80_07653 [Leptotrombidium deliense]|uniref:Uncharacterized protein n=1 Tax=Leptotrombidium deliense TaxID=299467 RepID=A0A443SVP2_9ACAR|nr:uncharacterized protein B4U80_07653 [Leptotrombidium deliense]
MDYLWYQIEKNIRKTNSFQIILVSITVHCLVSIVMIYVHLCWYFDVDFRKFEPLNVASKQGGISLLRHQDLNLVSSEVIDEEEIALIGWWKDHNKYDVNIVCFQQKGIACEKVFSTECKSDSIRAMYQYIPLKEHLKIREIDVALKANAQHLQEYVSEPTFGLFLLITLNTGVIEYIKVEFPSTIEEWTKRSIKYRSPENTQISKITLMLLCYGYSGTVFFTEISITPVFESNPTLAAEIIDHCGDKSYPVVPIDEEKYRIEYIQLPNGAIEHTQILTLVTQVSMDRMSILEKTLQTWSGPVSLAVYVPVKAVNAGLLEWQKLYLNKKLKTLNLAPGSNVVVVIGVEGDSDYPINKMRNAAIKQVKTKYSLILDADFQPSPDLKKYFSFLISKMNDTKKVAFVVPAFEYMEQPKKEDEIPKKKEELMQLIMRDDPLVQPFRISESVDSHKLTNYWKWYISNRPYYVFGYSDKYEPYLILENQHLPLFDEQFTGYGMNKVTHTTELFAAGYKFLVFSNAWTIHLPHKSSSYSQDFLQNPQQKLRNRHQRFQFIHGIIQKYKIKKKRCSQAKNY